MAKEFYDYMTGEIFSEDKTTLRDVLDSELLMVHGLVEISELKKMGENHQQMGNRACAQVIYERGSV